MMVKDCFKATALLLGLLCFFSLPLQAADPRAELLQILDKTPVFSAAFSQTVHKSDGSIMQGSRGTIALRQRSGQLLMHSLEPDELILLAKGQLVCFYDPFVNQATLFSVSQLQDSPFLLLSGSSRASWDRYEVTRDGEGYVLKSKKRSDVQELRLYFTNGFVSRIELKMQDGSLNVYELSSQRRAVDVGAFDFSIPDDAEIDDERGAK